MIEFRCERKMIYEYIRNTYECFIVVETGSY